METNRLAAFPVEPRGIAGSADGTKSVASRLRLAAFRHEHEPVRSHEAKISAGLAKPMLAQLALEQRPQQQFLTAGPQTRVDCRRCWCEVLPRV